MKILFAHRDTMYIFKIYSSLQNLHMMLLFI